jgi:hypothetical protein
MRTLLTLPMLFLPVGRRNALASRGRKLKEWVPPRAFRKECRPAYTLILAP